MSNTNYVIWEDTSEVLCIMDLGPWYQARAMNTVNEGVSIRKHFSH